MLKMSAEGFQAVQIARALVLDERYVRRLLKEAGEEMNRHRIPFGGDRLLKLLQRHHGEHYVRSPQRHVSAKSG